MNRLFSALLAGGAVAASAAAMAMLTPSGVTRTDLQRHDLSIEGRETVRLASTSPLVPLRRRHRHPGEEVIYILEGTLEYQLEGSAPVTLQPGDVLFVPANVAHTARNRTQNNGAELATYIVAKGRPLLELADVQASRHQRP